MKIHLHIIYIVVAVIAMAAIPLKSFPLWKSPNVVEQDREELLQTGEYAISPYDKIFRRVARRHNIDWILMSAMASGESHFNSDAVSPRGAVGIMQVMPHIAKEWDVERDELFDPAINIDVACRLYKSMQRMLRLPKDISEPDRMALTIASYNCGASRVIDARNLAEYYDEPTTEWSTVSEYLQLLSDEEYYNHEAVAGGKFKEGHITVAYTNRVLDHYDKFKRQVEGRALP